MIFSAMGSAILLFLKNWTRPRAPSRLRYHERGFYVLARGEASAVAQIKKGSTKLPFFFAGLARLTARIDLDQWLVILRRQWLALAWHADWLRHLGGSFLCGTQLGRIGCCQRQAGGTEDGLQVDRCCWCRGWCSGDWRRCGYRRCCHGGFHRGSSDWLGDSDRFSSDWFGRRSGNRFSGGNWLGSSGWRSGNWFGSDDWLSSNSRGGSDRLSGSDWFSSGGRRCGNDSFSGSSWLGSKGCSGAYWLSGRSGCWCGDRFGDGWGSYSDWLGSSVDQRGGWGDNSFRRRYGRKAQFSLFASFVGAGFLAFHAFAFTTVAIAAATTTTTAWLIALTCDVVFITFRTGVRHRFQDAGGSIGCRNGSRHGSV